MRLLCEFDTPDYGLVTDFHLRGTAQGRKMMRVCYWKPFLSFLPFFAYFFWDSEQMIMDESKDQRLDDKDEPDENIEESEHDSDFVESLPEELVESFTGERHLPHGRKTSKSYWVQVGRILLRLVFPRSRQMGFQVGFWVIRAFGALVLTSWLYFGTTAKTWDVMKLKAGFAILLLGPLVLRAVEFLLEHLLLRGSSRRSWKDFWNFRRMMTPRTIMTAFFVGFWILVIAGAMQVVSGFAILVKDRELGESTIGGMINEVEKEFNSAAGQLPKINGGDQPNAGEIFMPSGKVLNTKDGATTVVLNVEDGTTTQSIEDVISEVGDRISAAFLTAAFRRLPAEMNPEMMMSSGPSSRNWFSRILRGLLMMTLGPLALRFACESIILFFRINETLTDISRQLDRGLKRKASTEE